MRLNLQHESEMMSKFYGSADLTFAGQTYQRVLLCLDLRDNLISCSFQGPGADPKSAFRYLQLNRDDLTKSLSLTNIRITTPSGELRRDEWTDFYIGTIQPGAISVYDCELARALSLRSRSEGVVSVVLQPRVTLISFEFAGTGGPQSDAEIFYVGNKINHIEPSEVCFGSENVRVSGDREGLIVRSDTDLGAGEVRFRTCWAILQGHPLTIRAMLSGQDLSVNLMPADGGNWLAPLAEGWSRQSELLASLSRFITGMNDKDFAVWERASRFYLEGLTSNAPLEVRAINLTVFMEILDRSRTLSKNTLAQLLSLNDSEADFVCKLRNRLIHGGESIEKAANGALNNLPASNRERLAGGPFDVDWLLRDKLGPRVYLSLATVASKVWITRCGYKGRCFEYSDLAN